MSNPIDIQAIRLRLETDAARGIASIFTYHEVEPLLSALEAANARIAEMEKALSKIPDLVDIACDALADAGDEGFPPGFAAMVNTLADLKHDPEEAEAILAAWPAVLEVLRATLGYFEGDGQDPLMKGIALTKALSSLPTEIKKLVEGE